MKYNHKTMEILPVPLDSEYADISKEDIYSLRASIDALGMLGDTIASFNQNPVTLKIVCAMLFHIGKITKAYNVAYETHRILRILNKIKKSCLG